MVSHLHGNFFYINSVFICEFRQSVLASSLAWWTKFLPRRHMFWLLESLLFGAFCANHHYVFAREPASQPASQPARQPASCSSSGLSARTILKHSFLIGAVRHVSLRFYIPRPCTLNWVCIAGEQTNVAWGKRLEADEMMIDKQHEWKVRVRAAAAGMKSCFLRGAPLPPMTKIRVCLLLWSTE
jgi:hypothetical protein